MSTKKYIIINKAYSKGVVTFDEKGRECWNIYAAKGFSTKAEAREFAKKLAGILEVVPAPNGWDEIAIYDYNDFCQSRAVSIAYRHHTTCQVGSGRYSTYSVDHSNDLIKSFKKFGATVRMSGNDAPRGGKLGDYIDFEFSDDKK